VRGGEEEEEQEQEEEEVEHIDTEFTIVCPLRRIPEINCMWRGDLVGLQDRRGPT
jgi:hypothetical protein